jgi:hypothetical protein
LGFSCGAAQSSLTAPFFLPEFAGFPASLIWQQLNKPMHLAQNPVTTATSHPQGMAGLSPMPLDNLLTYQDVAAKVRLNIRTTARLLRGCPRAAPTQRTIRFREEDVRAFIERHWFGLWPAKADRSPDAKADGVRRTKRPVSA